MPKERTGRRRGSNQHGDVHDHDGIAHVTAARLYLREGIIYDGTSRDHIERLLAEVDRLRARLEDKRTVATRKAAREAQAQAAS